MIRKAKSVWHRMWQGKETLQKGVVYYDKNVGLFVQPREVRRLTITAGGFTHYYNDAITNNQTQILSRDYANENFMPIDALDKHPDLFVLCPTVHAWRLKTPS